MNLESLRRLSTVLAIAGPLAAQADAPPNTSVQQDLIARMKKTALRFQGQLPDFICTEISSRWEETTGTGNKWKRRDTLEQLVYFAHGGRTAIKLLKIDGKPTNRQYMKVGGIVEPDLLAGAIVPAHIFGPYGKPEFKWSRWETREGTRLAVFAFRAQPFVKNYPDGKHGFAIGFHGLVYANPADGMVMRLETHVDAAADYPFQDSGEDIDYGAVTISGRELILPVKAVTHLRRGKFLSRNETQVTAYRKYEADSAVTFGDSH